MTRKEFVSQVGIGAAALLLPACLGSLSGCSSSSDANGVFPAPPANPDFTIDVSTGALSNNGGFLVQNGIIIGRTGTGTFIAVSAACTHQGTTIQYVAGSNTFHCPNHGSDYSSTGSVINGPATQSLVQYKTELTGNSLRVFS
ncbi:MAG: Rieske (2Fe-2S) protein [Cyclobacteriaceae bacterium]|nr:Rieske (2Fe-2S) protein [Cyclobacteriaceae bacterium]